MSKREHFLLDLAKTIERHLPQRPEREGESASQPKRLSRFLRWLTPNGGTLLLVAVLLLTQQVWAGPLLGTTNVPGPGAMTINYQGRLADSDGVPLNGIYGMTFALYDAPTGGTLVWGSESHAAVSVSEGLFSVGLGSQTSGGIPTSVWENGDVYLEVSVGGETLEPRELIRSVPISHVSLVAFTVPDGAIGSAQIAAGAVNGQHIADNAVGSSEIATNAVGSSEIANGAVNTSELANRAVNSTKVTLTSGQLISTQDFNTTTSPQLIPGMSFTVNPPTNQVLVVLVSMDGRTTSSSGTMVGRLYVDGNLRNPPLTTGHPGVNGRSSAAGVFRIPLSAGSHTIELKAYTEGGSGGIIYRRNASIVYFMFSQ